jgi:hypothetical protein
MRSMGRRNPKNFPLIVLDVSASFFSCYWRRCKVVLAVIIILIHRTCRLIPRSCYTLDPVRLLQSPVNNY